MAVTKKKQANSSAIAASVIKGIQEKKGKHIISLDLREISTAICDFFIICEGDSNRQVDAIADAIRDEVIKDFSEKPVHAEGFENAEWILLDYIDVVVHIFQRETRAFYNLEGLWADAKTLEIKSDY